MRPKRFLSLICCLALLTSLLTPTAFAAGDEPIIDTEKYDFTVDEIAYKKVSESTVEVAIYQKVQPSTAGNAGAFVSSLYDGKPITIPATVTNDEIAYTVVGIGFGAFGSAKPTSVTLPTESEEFTYIGDSAFSACTLTSLTIPASVTEIGDGAFAWGSTFTSISFGEGSGLESIGDTAFAGCSSLASLTLPDTVQSIGSNVFADCTALSTITIPASVTDLDPAAFSTAGSFQNPYYGNGHTINFAEGCKYKIQDGILYDDESLLNVYEVKSSVTVPEGIKYIGDRAFKSASGLTSVTFPSTLVSIGTEAFYGTGLTSVTVPASVTSLGTGAFMGCTSLTTAEVNANIDTLPDYTFSGCTSLSSVTLPDGITSIGNYAFGRQSGTSKSTSLTSFDIPDSVTDIGTGAFRYCSSLNAIDLPSGLTSLGESVFQNTALTSVVLPEDITTIPKSTFSNVSSLKTVVLTGEVTSVGQNAFSGWKNGASECLLVITSETAPTFDSKAFGSSNSVACTPTGLTVLVPAAAKNNYTADGYILKDFVNDNSVYALDLPSTATITLNEGGGTMVLTGITVPTGMDLDITSGNTSVATVSGQTVTAVAAGDATIRAQLKVGGYVVLEKTCTVTVSPAAVPVSGVTLDQETLNLTVGGSGTLTATVSPDDATDKTVTWTTSNDDVATVVNGVVTAVAPGNAEITVTTSNGLTDTCAVTVTYAPVASVTLSETNISLTEGGAATLNATVSPANADPAVSWSSSDTAVVTVDENGNITAVAPGTATITVTAGGKSATCTVTVIDDGEVVPTVEKPVTDTEGIATEDQETAGDVAGSVAADEAVANAAQSAASSLDSSSTEKAELLQEGEEKLSPTGGEKVTLYTQTYLEIKATDLEKGTDAESSTVTSITLNITPMVQVVASTASSSADIEIKDNGDGSGNAVVVREPQALTINTSVEITVELPNNFAGRIVFVRHEKDGRNYFYSERADESGKLTFTSHNGFSPFTFSLTNDATAQVGEIGYGSLQEAVNAAGVNDTITLLQSGLSADTTKDLTLKNGTSSQITVTINGLSIEIEGGSTYFYDYVAPSSGGSTVTRYTVSVEDADNGSIRVSPTRASRGQTVTITVTPDDGYKLDELVVLDADGDEIDLTDKGDGKFTFQMPSSKVTVEATFTELEREPEPTEMSFIDVPVNAYYYDAVYWAVENGITDGTGDNIFSPDAACTRSQMVTFLWRAAGSPEPRTVTTSFTDVNTNAYYYDAVLWAVENGITNGTGTNTFSPDLPCTRAQMATFLWRAAGSPEPVSTTSLFTDVPTDAYYYDAVLWAAENGITNGNGANTYGPDVACTRAQMVTFLWRSAQ